MNATAALLTGPFVQAIGWSLLHLLWQGILVAAILAATLALLRNQSANARYLASCGALLLLVALGGATAVRAYDPALPPAVPPVITSLLADPPALAEGMGVAWTASASTWRDSMMSLGSYAGRHLPQVVALWLLGVLILSIRLVVGWAGAHRLTTRDSHGAGADWERALDRVAGALDLRRRIRLLQSAAVEVPAVIGWFRPVVLLPVATLSGLSVPQIEMILGHELAHIRRHDFIVNLMQSVIETLLFYHPAVWWISRRIRVEREHCCDDLAVSVFGDPVQYARALTRFEELRAGAQSVLAANGGSLFDRIRRLVLRGAETSNRASRWAAGAALLTVLAAILVAPALPLFANRDEQTPPVPPARTRLATPAETATCDKASTPAEAVVDVEAVPPDDESAVAEGVAGGIAEGVAGGVRIAPVAIAVPAIRINTRRMLRAVLAPRVMTALPPMPPVPPMPPLPAIAAMGWQSGSLRHRAKIGTSGKLSVDDLIVLSGAGVTPKYIEEMRAAGLGGVSLDDIVAMRVHGVTSAYVRAMRDAGVDVNSADTVTALRSMGVNADYVKEMAAAGYAHLSARDLIELRSQGVSAAFVKSLAEAGYANLSARDLVRLRASGVSADFIRELSKYRTK